MRINESVSVSTATTGIPIAFVWRAVSYAVITEPEIWFKKTPWWRGQSAPSLHQTAPERTIFRVTALPCSGPRSLASKAPNEGVYDLAFISGEGWMLTDAHTDEIDTQLFA